jgi:hypothetical protein
MRVEPWAGMVSTTGASVTRDSDGGGISSNVTGGKKGNKGNQGMGSDRGHEHRWSYQTPCNHPGSLRAHHRDKSLGTEATRGHY